MTAESVYTSCIAGPILLGMTKMTNSPYRLGHLGTGAQRWNCWRTDVPQTNLHTQFQSKRLCHIHNLFLN